MLTKKQKVQVRSIVKGLMDEVKEGRRKYVENYDVTEEISGTFDVSDEKLCELLSYSEAYMDRQGWKSGR